VIGLLDRETRQFRYSVLNDLRTEAIDGHVREAVEPGSAVCTDAFASYRKLDAE